MMLAVISGFVLIKTKVPGVSKGIMATWQTTGRAEPTRIDPTAQALTNHH
jgi:hypothetical protein